ncbi:hypothetical protein DFH07DRAFT_778350 [Mycena maculata]|uniref:Uncharacterized protein n=1 Tax=Mycena maculata TaxID=230809 RepID=A0AAD7N1X0_9AGAR|nr:hypothetical protein DFH07DRAFT_778350 [Mycena maculata]
MSEAGMGTGMREEEKGVAPAEKGTLGLLVPFTYFGLDSTSASPALDQHISAPEKGGPFVVGLIHARNLSTKPNTAAWDNEASFDGKTKRRAMACGNATRNAVTREMALEHSLPLALEFWAFKLRHFIGGSILHWDRKLDLQNVFLMRYKGSNAPSKDECARRCFISEVFPVGTNTNTLTRRAKTSPHTRRCFIDEGCPNWVNTKDALPSFIKGRGAPNKDESARRGFIGEVFLIGTNMKNVPLTCPRRSEQRRVRMSMFYWQKFPNWVNTKDALPLCIKGPGALSKDEPTRPCFIGEVFPIGPNTNVTHIHSNLN